MTRNKRRGNNQKPKKLEKDRHVTEDQGSKRQAPAKVTKGKADETKEVNARKKGAVDSRQSKTQDQIKSTKVTTRSRAKSSTTKDNSKTKASPKKKQSTKAKESDSASSSEDKLHDSRPNQKKSNTNQDESSESDGDGEENNENNEDNERKDNKKHRDTESDVQSDDSNVDRESDEIANNNEGGDISEANDDIENNIEEVVEDADAKDKKRKRNPQLSELWPRKKARIDVHAREDLHDWKPLSTDNDAKSRTQNLTTTMQYIWANGVYHNSVFNEDSKSSRGTFAPILLYHYILVNALMCGTVCDKSAVEELSCALSNQRKVHDIVALDITATALCTETGMQAKTIAGAFDKLIYLEMVARVESRGVLLLLPPPLPAKVLSINTNLGLGEQLLDAIKKNALSKEEKKQLLKQLLK